MADSTDPPAEVLARLREVCLALPEACEEPAWTGTRWRIRMRTFAHVLVIEAGWPPAYARATGTRGPATVLMFRSSGPELDVLRACGDPFFAPVWRVDEVGMVIDERTDWHEVGELLMESYCLQAPKSLSRLVERPDD
jgi:hypothetical protein